MKGLWTPDFIIALILIVGAFSLLAFGIDGEVKAILTVATGWVFGSALHTRRNNKKRSSK